MMIELKNIHISFDEVLLDNAQMNIIPGKITAIVGKSGSGKTSLLNLIGLLKKDEAMIYHYHDTNVSLLNDQQQANLRKSKIGYVFQDYALFDHLSIYENLQFYIQMTGCQLSEKSAKLLIKKVGLNKNIHQTITTLSGGERQRLAIACALSKQPELLILDEPTSALDTKNANMVMETLKQLASNGMMILVTSHDKNIVKQCDIIYRIENKHLLTTSQIAYKDQQSLQLKNSFLPFSFFFHYFLNYLKKNRMIYLGTFLVVGICMSIFCGYQYIGNSFEKLQYNLLNELGNREILITSEQDSEGNGKYRFGMNMISEEKLRNIQESTYLQSIIPFYECYVMQANGEKIQNTVIQPYTKSSYVYSYMKDEGVYISSGLKDILTANEIYNFEVYLPTNDQLQLNDISIIGIIEDTYQNKWSDNKNIIFVPMELLPTLEEYSAYLVYAKTYEDVDRLVKDIKGVDVNFGLSYLVLRTNHLVDFMHSILQIKPLMMMVVTLLTCALMIIVYSRYMSNREKEYCLLKINGLSKNEIYQMMFVELMIQATMISIFAMMSSFGLFTLVKMLFELNISVNIGLYYAKLLCASFILIFVPTMMTTFIIQKNEPADMLRKSL